MNILVTGFDGYEGFPLAIKLLKEGHCVIGLDNQLRRNWVSKCGSTSAIPIEPIPKRVKQLKKLVDVQHATEHKGQKVVEKELALIKVKTNESNRSDILQMTDHFKAQTVDFTDESLVIEVTGGTEKLDAMISMLEKYGILEFVRTGKILVARGKEHT